ncbi:MAG: hypothetical protein AMXMBFR58_21740 [Phycisphaerae bacterium]|nr:hypothetical protein [Phycisphaerales bacterium]
MYRKPGRNLAWCSAIVIAGAGVLGFSQVAAQDSPAREGQPEQERPRFERRGPRRDMEREPLTREELTRRLQQRVEELDYLKQQLDGLRTKLESADVTDQQLQEMFTTMRPGARWFLLGGLGEQRGEESEGEGGRGRPWGGGPWSARDHAEFSRPVTDEDVTRILAWMDEHMPRLSKRAHELQQTDPEALKRIVQRMRPRVGELERLAKENPQAAKIRIEEWQAGLQVVEAGRELRDKITSNAPGDQVEAAREQVKAALAAQFDAQLEVQASEVAAFTARVERAKVRLDERRASREAWLKERLAEIEAGQIEKPGKGK